jgi:hypothetical protein
VDKFFAFRTIRLHFPFPLKKNEEFHWCLKVERENTRAKSLMTIAFIRLHLQVTGLAAIAGDPEL